MRVDASHTSIPLIIIPVLVLTTTSGLSPNVDVQFTSTCRQPEQRTSGVAGPAWTGHGRAPVPRTMRINFWTRRSCFPVVDLAVDNNSRYSVVHDSDILWTGPASSASFAYFVRTVRSVLSRLSILSQRPWTFDIVIRPRTRLQDGRRQAFGVHLPAVCWCSRRCV